MNSKLNIENFLNDFSTNCKNVQKKSFRKNQTITTYIQKRNQVCIILNGEADLVRYDLNGNKSIIEHFTKNDIFGEALFKIYTDRELFVLAKKKSKVLFYPYDTAELCTEDCLYHIDILRNMPDLILHSIAQQNLRMMLLTTKGVRDKLLTYFQSLSLDANSKTFELPFTLTDLSDYLMIERTAMMREIKRLKDENIIKKVKNKITLL